LTNTLAHTTHDGRGISQREQPYRELTSTANSSRQPARLMLGEAGGAFAGDCPCTTLLSLSTASNPATPRPALSSCHWSTTSCAGWPCTGCAAWTAATLPTIDAPVASAGEPPYDHDDGSDIAYENNTVYARRVLFRGRSGVQDSAQEYRGLNRQRHRGKVFGNIGNSSSGVEEASPQNEVWP
jgi:hypothetical protein